MPPIAPPRPSGRHNDASDPAFKLTAKAMLETARRSMDEYAREIFDLWFSGKAPAQVVFDNPKWAKYMSSEKNLTRQIDRALAAHAELLRPQVNASQGKLQGPLKLNFHAEVGSNFGEYRTGYDVLHGSNKSAGDFVITGKFTAARAGDAGEPYTVTYEELAFVFNDIVDINKKYKADVQFGQMAANMAKALGGLPPKDYILRIMWRVEKPCSYEFDAEVKGAAPAFLKQWKNR
jgi:hypothetical protein